MRFTNQIRPLLVGLPILVSQAFVVVQPVVGWEWNVFQIGRQRSGSDQSAGREQAPHRADDATLDGRNRAASPWTKRPASRRSSANRPHRPVAKWHVVRKTRPVLPAEIGPTFTANRFACRRNFSRAAADSTRPANLNPVTKKIPGAAVTPAGMRQGSPTPTVASSLGNASIHGNPPARRKPLPPELPRIQTPRPGCAQRPNHGPPRRINSPQRSRRNSRSRLPNQPWPHRQGLQLAEPTPAETGPGCDRAQDAGRQTDPASARIFLQGHARKKTSRGSSKLAAALGPASSARSSTALPINWLPGRSIAADSSRRKRVTLKEAMLDFDDAIRSNPKTVAGTPQSRRAEGSGRRVRIGLRRFQSHRFNSIRISPKHTRTGPHCSSWPAIWPPQSTTTPTRSSWIRTWPIAHRGRARTCHQLGRLDEALDHYDAAVQLSPDDAYAVAGRADCSPIWAAMSTPPKDTTSAIQLDPQSAGALRGSAWLLPPARTTASATQI